jgi:hypothetical protein
VSYNQQQRQAPMPNDQNQNQPKPKESQGEQIGVPKDELNKIENLLVVIRNALGKAAATNPDAQKLMQEVVDCERIISSKLGNEQGQQENTESYAGGGGQTGNLNR